MEQPVKITPSKLADYLEVMSKSVFQTGISWKVVEAKWEGFRQALDHFNPETLARLTPEDVDRLAQDSRIIRNRRKIEATIANAATMLDLDREFKGFGNYLKSHASYDELSHDLVKRFRFLGGMGAYHFLWVIGEPVPPYEEWRAAQASESSPRRGVGSALPHASERHN